jgi:hypothetical protein
VRREVQKLGVDYPVAIDNDHAIWRAFENNYWPALFFIDAQGGSGIITSARATTSSPNGSSNSCLRRPA